MQRHPYSQTSRHRISALFGAGLALAVLSGCGETGASSIADASSLIWKDDTPVYDPVAARELPYATMEAALGLAPPSLVVLGRLEGNRHHWITADRVVIVTENGRVVQTAGFPNDLLALRPLDPTASTSETMFTVDLAHRDLYGIRIFCRSGPSEKTALDIRGVTKDVWKTSEYCTTPDFDWEFENVFWRDESGYTWKSEQHFSPDTPPLELSILKPAATR